MDVRTSTRFRRGRAAVRSARAFVGHALRSGGAPADVITNMELAVAEACNNAILHSGSATFTVGVTVEDSAAEVVVADAGAGFDPPRHPTMPAPDAEGRRGLALMQAMVDEVELNSTAAGTTVVLRQPLAGTTVRAEPLPVEG